MITIIETQQFISKADKIISAAEKDDLFDFIARNPKEGDVISGTGGVRKLRFAIQGKGKRGGARLFIITIMIETQCCFSLCLEKTKNRI